MKKVFCGLVLFLLTSCSSNWSVYNPRGGEAIIVLIFVAILIGLIMGVASFNSNNPDSNKSNLIKDPKTGYYVDTNFVARQSSKNKEDEEAALEKKDPDRFEKKIAKIVKKEIDSQKYNEVTWLQAFKKARGNKQEAQALYAEYRTDQLEEQFYNNANTDQKRNNITKVQYKKVRSGREGGFFENSNFLSGREELATAFWLYVFAGNLVVGIIAGFLSVGIGSFMIIILIPYLIFSTVGLWKCADNYTVLKQKMKEPYGWALGAKIYVVINLLYLPVQIFQFIRN